MFQRDCRKSVPGCNEGLQSHIARTTPWEALLTSDREVHIERLESVPAEASWTEVP